MKKSVFLICVFIIIVISCVVAFYKVNGNKEKLNYELEQVTSINYKVISENNKFGVINKNGEVIVSPIYDEIDIPNPSKPLFICMYGYNTQNQQYNIKVLNDKSEQILYEYVVVEAIKINPTISEIPYEKSVLKYKRNGKYGLIDFDGNVIVKPEYEQIDSLDYKEGLLNVKKDGKFGVINIKGATVVKAKYDEIQSDGYYEEGAGFDKIGFIVGKKTDNYYKFGYINFNGKQVLDVKYNQIERIQNTNKNEDTYLVAFEDGKAGFYKNKENIIKHEYEDIAYDINNDCLILQKDSKQGISDLSGNIVIDIQYDNIFTSGKYVNAQSGSIVDVYDYVTKQKITLENIIAVNETLNSNYAIVITNDEKHQILDVQKNEIRSGAYDYLEYMYDDFFIASNNEKFGIVDINGKELVKFKYDFIQKNFDNKIVLCVVNKNNVTDLVIQNKVITSMKNADVQVGNNFVNIQSEKASLYFDFEGNSLDNTQLFDAQLYAFQKKGKWGFVNQNSEIVVDPVYDFVTEFNEFGFAGIRKDGKWGSINSSGEIVVEPCYEIDWQNPVFIGKYYEVDLGYGVPYFACE